MHRFDGVIFDMDGLLFDTETIYYEATQAVADEFGFPYDKELYLRFLGVSDEELFAGYHELYDAQFGEALVQQFAAQAYQRALDFFARGEVALKPGARELLAYLAAHEIPCIVASSNTRKIIEMLLAHAEIATYFTGIVCADDVSRAKPDPAIFLKAQQTLNLPAERLLIFEDSTNGILAADRAGISVVLVPDLVMPVPEVVEKTCAVLSSLHDAPKFLQK